MNTEEERLEFRIAFLEIMATASGRADVTKKALHNCATTLREQGERIKELEESYNKNEIWWQNLYAKKIGEILDLEADNALLKVAARRADNIEEHRDELLQRIEELEKFERVVQCPKRAEVLKKMTAVIEAAKTFVANEEEIYNVGYYGALEKAIKDLEAK